MSKELHKKEPAPLRTIDITPKWSAIVIPLLHLYRTHSHHSGDPSNLGTLCSTCTSIRDEFRKMACAADLYNETRGK